jgi:hypothetical protein
LGRIFEPGQQGFWTGCAACPFVLYETGLKQAPLDLDVRTFFWAVGVVAWFSVG